MEANLGKTRKLFSILVHSMQMAKISFCLEIGRKRMFHNVNYAFMFIAYDRRLRKSGTQLAKT